MLEQIAAAPETSVVFESPERVATLLQALVALVADDRQVVVAREMTKIHEEFFRGTMAEAARYYAENKARGEVTVVVSPRSPAEGMAEVRESVDEAAARALARALVDEGLTPEPGCARSVVPPRYCQERSVRNRPLIRGRFRGGVGLISAEFHRNAFGSFF